MSVSDAEPLHKKFVECPNGHVWVITMRPEYIWRAQKICGRCGERYIRATADPAITAVYMLSGWLASKEFALSLMKETDTGFL